MERFRRMQCHWQPPRNFYRQDPSVFYLYVAPHHGIADHSLHGTRLLAQHAQLHQLHAQESLVLSLMKF